MVLGISFFNIPNDQHLAYNPRLHSIIAGEVEAGMSKGGDTQHCQEQREMNVAGVTFSIHTAQDPCLEIGATHRGLGLPTAIILVKTNPSDMPVV